MCYRTLVLGVALLGLTGCAHQQTRLQNADESDRDKDKKAQVQTIGDLTTYSNADAIPVSGVGLVVGLEGTGGEAPAGGYRTMLEDSLRKAGVQHVKEVLASADASLVLVSAEVPPGAHKGDPIDIEISLPPQSKTTSLRGGYLKECVLYNYDTTKHLDPNFEGGNRMLLGHSLVKAEGALLVGVGEGEAGDLRHGRVWSGGRCKVDRPFYIIMNSDHQRAPVVQRIAQRINETFHGPARSALGELAVAKTTSYLTLKVPEQYKLNLPRYLRVVRLIPFDGLPPEGSPYRTRLQEELLDPTHTVTAALRLEALGSDSLPILKLGLENPHPLVRFTSAEALAYLGCPASGEELARVVENQPLLRAYALTALASLDEAVSRVKLRELLASQAPEARYGAFRALRALDDQDPAVQGEWLNESYWLHRLSPESTPLVHVSTSRRAEILVYGEKPALAPPLNFLAGEFTVTAAANDSRCIISRLSVRHGANRRQCSLDVQSVVRCMAEMGASYPDLVELLRNADKFQCLNCPLAVDALPQALSVYDLAKDGATNPNLHGADQDILKAQDDFGATPTLYEKPANKRGRKLHGDEDQDNGGIARRAEK
jgi:hypothetical protein